MTRAFLLLGLLSASASWAQDVADPAVDDANLWFDAHNLFVTAFDGDLRDPLRGSLFHEETIEELFGISKEVE